MDRSMTNDQQWHAIETLDRPVLLNAGAGAGKTATLSKRIAYSLEQKQVSAVDRLMGITFTKKAAGELMNRVRKMLRQEHLDKEASNIDEAWISTIDAMCKKMVTRHSLQIGVDPNFDMLGQVETDLLLNKLVNEVLEAHADEPEVKKLLRSWNGEVASEIFKLVTKLELYFINDESTSLEPLHAPGDPMLLMGSLVGAMSNVDPAVGDESLALVGPMIDAWRRFEKGNVSRETMIQIFQETVDDGVWSKAKVKKACPDLIDLLTETMMALYESVEYPKIVTLLNLAREVRRKFDAWSQENSKYDFTQVLNITRKMFVENPALAAKYREHLQLVMVDEFQDTNQQQIDLITMLTGDDLATLATVGDEQQSIYAFRGSDVSLYREHKQKMEKVQAECITMFDNYRSHKDILTAVNAVFGDEEIFGENLIRLKASRPEPEPPVITSGHARINVLEVDGKVDDLHGESYANVAYEFARLVKEENISPSDMAILLPTLNDANKYVAALSKVGITAIQYGGSNFYKKTPEVKILISLLKMLANPNCDADMINVLSSKIFSIGMEDFYYIGWRSEIQGSNLWQRLRTISESSSAPKSLVYASEAIGASRRALGRVSVSIVMQYLLEASGWLVELQSGGASNAAILVNINQFMDFVRIQETEGMTNITELAAYFSELEEYEVKQSPAAVVATQAVRIMTIHASKGLEFPVVAVGDVRSSRASGMKFMMYSDSLKELHLLPAMGDSDLAQISRAKTKKSSLRSNMTLAAAHERTMCSDVSQRKEIVKRNEEEETYRKFYVAFTRARDWLFVCTKAENKPLHNVIAQNLLPAQARETLISSAAETGRGVVDSIIPGSDTQVKYTYVDSKSELYERPANAEGLQNVTKPKHVEINQNVLKPVMGVTEPLHVSFSSLSSVGIPRKKAADEPVEITSTLESDWDGTAEGGDATSFGTAFHYIAQRSVETNNFNPESLMEKFSWGMQESEENQRLKAAIFAYCNGGVLDFAKDAICHCEQAFMLPVSLSNGRAFTLEGSIDLLVEEACGVVILDYKTGQSPLDSELIAVHRFQGLCYALALLEAGHKKATCVFYHVETGQVAKFKFDSSMIDAMRSEVISTYLLSA